MGGKFRHPPLLLLPRDPQGLPVWAERVDAWLRLTVSTSRTGGASSLPQYQLRHLSSRPNLLCDSGLCKFRLSQCALYTLLMWYNRKMWRSSSV